MNSPLHKLNKVGSLTAKLILTAMLMVPASAPMAEGSEIAYVDSVHKWGAWELDIEPAAGGLSQPTTQALNARNSKVALRTNSFSALAPTQIQKAPVAPPVAPPVVPTITYINPGVPIPIGGPSDGF